MYAYIKGTLEEVLDNQVVIDNHGIGYRILTSAGTINALPPRGEMVRLYTYLHVKEDEMSLYGFRSKDDLSVFTMLLNVNGIGPKGALGILSVLSADDLRFAVAGADAKAIAKAPGIGAKTAQRVILELKDKLKIEDAFHDEGMEDVAVFGGAFQSVKTEAIQALTALGYSSQEAVRTLSGIEITETMNVEDVLKAALKQMALM